MGNTIKENRKILRIVKLLSGLPRVNIYDILYKVEYTFNAIDTLNRKNVTSALFALDNPMAEELIDGSFILLLDYNFTIKIYLMMNPNSFFYGVRCQYYFSSAFEKELRPLTKKNILRTFKHTTIEYSFQEFFKTHKTKDINPKTERFSILEMTEKTTFNNSFIKKRQW